MNDCCCRLIKYDQGNNFVPWYQSYSAVRGSSPARCSEDATTKKTGTAVGVTWFVEGRSQDGAGRGLVNNGEKMELTTSLLRHCKRLII